MQYILQPQLSRRVRGFHETRDRATSHVVNTTPAKPTEKPARWATILTYFIFAGIGLSAYRACTKDDSSAAKTASEPVKVAPTPETPEPAPAPPVEPEKPKTVKGYRLSAAALLAAYEENEVAADEKFKGQLVEVTGKIDTIGKDILGDPYITIGSGKDFEFQHVQAQFAADAVKQLAGLRKGQTVVVQCTCAGKMMNVVGKDCVLKPAS